MGVPLSEPSTILTAAPPKVLYCKFNQALTQSFIMALTFPRIQAGEYQINDGHKPVGYILKKSSSKWIMYKCSNPSMLGNPISVKKTLKDLKLDAECMIGSSPAPSVEMNEDSLELDSLLKDVKAQNPDKYEMMKGMLETDYVIDLNEYRQTEDGLEAVKQPFSEFLTPEQIESL